MGYTSQERRSEGPPALVRLRVSPGAKRTEIVGRHGEAWKARVAAPPERGRANEALLELLAEALGLPRRRLTLVAGAAARDKLVEVEGMTTEEVNAVLGNRARGETV